MEVEPTEKRCRQENKNNTGKIAVKNTEKKTEQTTQNHNEIQ